MKTPSFVAAAALIAAMGATTPLAIAQSASNYSVSQVIADIGPAIPTLQHDQEDYGGHRVRAIGHLRAAERQLEDSLSFAQAHAYPLPAGSSHVDYPSWERTNQAASDENIRLVQQHSTAWINQLEGDGLDYGGHRLKAINAIRAAQTELGLAIEYARAHGH